VEVTSVNDFFEETERRWRESTPWPWPRSLTDDELAFYCSAWPDLNPTSGAFIGEEIVIKSDYPGTVRCVTINLNGMTIE
jgi:hypothetical protein